MPGSIFLKGGYTGVGARDTCVLNITHFHISKFLNLLCPFSFTLSLFHPGLLVIVFVTRRRHHRVLIGVRCPGRVHASLNYTITDQLYPRDKNSRDLSVQRVFFSLPARNPVSLLVAAPKSATHARIGERGSVHIVERLRPKNPNLPLGRPHCFVSGSPAPRIMRWLRGFLAI